jgi:hypothetical protein
MTPEERAEAEQLYRAAVGENADYYVHRFIDFDGFNASRTSWNWPAFFVTFLWMLYRRMYGYAAVYVLLVPLVVGGVTFVVLRYADPRAAPWINALVAFFAFYVFVPSHANAMYHANVARRIVKSQARAGTLAEQVELLQKSKRTSNLAVAVGMLITLVGAGAGLMRTAFELSSMAARSQVSEGLSRIGWLQADIESYYYQNDRRWPKDGGALHLDQASNGRYIASLEVMHGHILIKYGNEAVRQISGKVLVLKPIAREDGRIAWSCGEAGESAVQLSSGYWPQTCVQL